MREFHLAKYIAGAVAAIDAELKAGLPALLDARGREQIAEWGHADTGLLRNSPTVWVTPGTNAISDEGQGLTQEGTVRVIIGIGGADPEALVMAAMDYVGAVTDALEAVDSWGDNIRHVHAGHQDYSARFRRGNGFAIFPAITVTVEMTEVL
jgi:hypothetical protein